MEHVSNIMWRSLTLWDHLFDGWRDILVQRDDLGALTPLYTEAEWERTEQRCMLRPESSQGSSRLDGKAEIIAFGLVVVLSCLFRTTR